MVAEKVVMVRTVVNYANPPRALRCIPAPGCATALQLMAVFTIFISGLMGLGLYASGQVVPVFSMQNVMLLHFGFWIFQVAAGIFYLIRAPRLRRGDRRSVPGTLALVLVHVGALMPVMWLGFHDIPLGRHLFRDPLVLVILVLFAGSVGVLAGVAGRLAFLLLKRA